MTRVEFTEKIVFLLSQMVAQAEKPIIDYVLRSTEEQQRLFAKGRVNNGGQWQIVNKNEVVTYCDGITKPSKHNSATAMDIYFIVDGKMDFSKDRYIKWHKQWESMGGRAMLDFDMPHYE